MPLHFAEQKYAKTDLMHIISEEFKNRIYNKYGYEIFSIYFSFSKSINVNFNKLYIFFKYTDSYLKCKADLNIETLFIKLDKESIFGIEFINIVQELQFDEYLAKDLRIHIYNFEFFKKESLVADAAFKLKKNLLFQQHFGRAIFSFYNHKMKKFVIFGKFKNRKDFNKAVELNLLSEMKTIAYSKIKELDKYDYFNDVDFAFAVDYQGTIFREYFEQEENIEHMTFI